MERNILVENSSYSISIQKVTEFWMSWKAKPQCLDLYNTYSNSSYEPISQDLYFRFLIILQLINHLIGNKANIAHKNEATYVLSKESKIFIKFCIYSL